MELVEFLLARIAEDEEVAREALVAGLIGPEWWDKLEHGRVYSGHWVPVVQTTSYTEQNEDPEDNVEHHGLGTSALIHIARHDPARVLAECEAKRAIVERWQQTAERLQVELGQTHGGWTLGLLALPYADHPDYDPEWRP